MLYTTQLKKDLELLNKELQQIERNLEEDLHKFDRLLTLFMKKVDSLTEKDK